MAIDEAGQNSLLNTVYCVLYPAAQKGLLNTVDYTILCTVDYSGLLNTVDYILYTAARISLAEYSKLDCIQQPRIVC